MKFSVNGEAFDLGSYAGFHSERFRKTLDEVKSLEPTSILELGGHPWVMTAKMIHEGLPLTATVSAEEYNQWTDSLDETSNAYELVIEDRACRFDNYSANIERDWINPEQQVSCVLACEIIEHLVRAPHRMLLNCNRWLEMDGYLLLTTPNGAQFSNPFRSESKSPRFRSSVYSRHNRLFNLQELVDLAECCGFQVQRAEHWQVYPRQGLSQLYDVFGKLPGQWFKSKFTRTLFVLAKKIESRTTASRLPIAYMSEPGWDHIDGEAG